MHATIDEAFATDLLLKFVKSGDVARIVNENLGNSISVAATGGKVEFQNGSITVTINFKVPGACGRIATLHFTASLSGPPQVSNGNLSITAQYVDISFDTTDEILCLLLSGWAFPIYAGFFAFFNSVLSPATPLPVSYTIAPLPGSEKDLALVMKQATADQGMLAMDGIASITSDVAYSFIYVRVVSVTPPVTTLTTPIEGAQVTLIQLLNPEPSGDNAPKPKTGKSSRTVGRYILEDDISFNPAADVNLQTQTTDATGLVRFNVSPNSKCSK